MLCLKSRLVRAAGAVAAALAVTGLAAGPAAAAPQATKALVFSGTAGFGQMVAQGSADGATVNTVLEFNGEAAWTFESPYGSDRRDAYATALTVIKDARSGKCLDAAVDGTVTLQPCPTQQEALDGEYGMDDAASGKLWRYVNVESNGVDYRKIVSVRGENGDESTEQNTSVRNCLQANGVDQRVTAAACESQDNQLWTIVEAIG